jgi:hypothetical protein
MIWEPMTTSPSKAIEHIACPTCTKPTKATRVGAQDYCDVYVCKNEHITRIKVGAPRKEWNELATGNSKPA